MARARSTPGSNSAPGLRTASAPPNPSIRLSILRVVRRSLRITTARITATIGLMNDAVAAVASGMRATDMKYNVIAIIRNTVRSMWAPMRSDGKIRVPWRTAANGTITVQAAA